MWNQDSEHRKLWLSFQFWASNLIKLMFQVLTGIFGVGAKTAARWIREGIHTLDQLRGSGQALNQAQRAGVCVRPSVLCVVWFLLQLTPGRLRSGALRWPQPVGHQGGGGRHRWDRGESRRLCAAGGSGYSDWRLQEVKLNLLNGSGVKRNTTWADELLMWT